MLIVRAIPGEKGGGFSSPPLLLFFSSFSNTYKATRTHSLLIEVGGGERKKGKKRGVKKKFVPTPAAALEKGWKESKGKGKGFSFRPPPFSLFPFPPFSLVVRRPSIPLCYYYLENGRNIFLAEQKEVCRRRRWIWQQLAVTVLVHVLK